jgi:polyisoprenoid-binding protein YceI
MILITMLAALPGAAPASLAATWQIDPSHSSAQFGVRHLMISTVRGQFGKVSGTVEFDGKSVASIEVHATIDAASLDTRDARRDEHLRSPDFFDVAKYPTLTFKSKRAEAAGAGRFKLVGDLMMHGVTKEIVLDVEGPTPPMQDPWGNTRVGAVATGKINRADFGITWNKALDAGGVLVGEEVAITLDVELVQQKTEADEVAK